ncbi:MAG TPA: iron-containing alcohol dehydrogenase family protein [Desulfosporosinus sp.]|nr:iron-containing alcohol dehydrogenase family protein [Desulfosporosinus sp.]
MIFVKAPQRYINEAGILKSSGDYIGQLGKNALIIGGKTALRVVEGELFRSLDSGGVKYQTIEFQGNCTTSAINRFVSITGDYGVDLIIGVGGGRVLDLAKAVGEKRKLPVVAVPTIVATCAAWSALSIIYDEFGKFAGGLPLNSSPTLVLADTRILAEAPVRYLSAGIGDTIAKWYEIAPHIVEGKNDISLRIGIQTAKLALEILTSSATEATKDAADKKPTQVFSEVVDAIIVLAGLVGSITGGYYRAAVAHALHNSFTVLPEIHSSLHGEIVAFGLIVQFVLEEKPQQEIDKFIAFLNSLDLSVTLGQLGIKNDLVQKISEIANGVNISGELLDKLNFEVNSRLIEKAIIKADELGQSSLNS